MNPILRKVIGLQEHEIEGGKLRPEVVVYMTPEQLPSEGAHCGACMFFRASTEECLLTSPPACNAAKGVCAAFIKSDSIFKDDGSPLQVMPKTQVGYVTEGPTHCANCEYYSGEPDGEGSCEKVGGEIHGHGCCNGWESGDEE